MSSGLPDSYPRLLGDIGGTNARFALQPAPGVALQAVHTLRCADYADPHAAIRHYLQIAGSVPPRWAAVGIANPITGDDVRMTNHHWAFSIEALRHSLGLERLLLLNDFTALALALPHLRPTELIQVGGGEPVAGAAMALLGAGTGLGISGLLPSDNGFVALNGEGGHVTLPATDALERALIERLALRFGHVSAERVLSGPGLEAVYQTLCELRGEIPAAHGAPEIGELGRLGQCPFCEEALEVFCAMLGTVAADLALILGARGGVYIGGGIVPKLGEFFQRSRFRQRFEDKGRFSAYLAAIPVYVIHAPFPALLGAACALDDERGRGRGRNGG